MYIIEDILTADELAWVRSLIKRGRYVAGAATAGGVARAVKQNEQLECSQADADQLARLVMGALKRSAKLQRSALPLEICRPTINRYGPDMNYGPHYDSTFMPDMNGQRIRGDMSMTIFISDPDSYDGGELCFARSGGEHAIKLKAGHGFVYPASTLHWVKPVTRGERVGIVFWLQSMIRDPEKRAMITELDEVIMRIAQKLPDSDEVRDLSGLESNLLRMWSEL
jgi:PKHD-type hydroxylase